MIQTLTKYALALPTNASYLELGCNEGRSLEVVVRNGHPTNLTVCDMWGTGAGGRGRGSHAHIQVLLDSIGFTGHVLWLDGSSHELLGKDTVVLPESQDMILVDGDHSYEGAEKDLNDCWPLLKPGGVMVFDDISHHQHMYLKECAICFGAQIGRKFDTFDLSEGCGVCAWVK